MISAHASPLAATEGVDVGGQSVRVAALSAALARRGHEVTVYTRRDDPKLPDRVRGTQGYTVVHVPAGPPRALRRDSTLEYLSDFADYLDAQWAQRRPDVAHAHFWMSGLASLLAARKRDVPTVQTFYTLASLEDGAGVARDVTPEARFKMEPLVAKQSTWVTATSTDEVFRLIRLGRSRSRISVVPCGVDPDRFTTAGPAADRKDNVRRILSVGKLAPRKGFDAMIAALPLIPDAEYVVVGGPPARQLDTDHEVIRLRALADRMGVSDRVTFTGAVAHADMPALFRSADVVTCTPSYEPSGMAPLEAMACGVPVVASAVGGMRDTIVHDVTGHLIAPGRHRELAEAVSMLLRDGFLRRSFGLAGRDRVCARYSWDRIATDTLRVYEKVGSGHTSRAQLPVG
ncbi:glycosyl transferase [Mycolicibacterium anyangense]|jgi:glycosyltransferase involved in cell wall biosynthesis|uniref:Glycosyl transferase n=2 Tax=Mycolicibacterium anyangense TaxID=1431246 RepID=A0A6N4WH78_9MYCO|nr:glycosyl transferase [Mycolicibacterium anyangense]